MMNNDDTIISHLSSIAEKGRRRTMPYDLCIVNALLADETGVWPGALGIRGGAIAAVFADAPDAAADETIDAAGKLVLPGLVDAHVHFNEPGRAEWEGFACGSSGAAAGGITTVVDMPLNNHPAAVDGPTLAAKRAALEGRSLIDYLLWGGLVTDNVATLSEQDAAGAAAYKAFMSNSGIDDFAAVTDGVLLDGLRHAASVGKLVAVHAESEALTSYLTAQIRRTGRTDRRAWCDSRPPLAEAEAIGRALLLARAAGARLHVVHVSTAAGIDLVNAARAAGQKVSCETCPHYLTLDEEDFVAIGPAAKCAPPLRPRAEVEALWERVLAGNVDLIASDHSPCPTEDKHRGDDDIWAAWGGIAGVQLLLPLLLDEGVHRRDMPLPMLVRLTSTNPARLFGLHPRKGSLRPGADADLAIVDPNEEWTVRAEDLFAQHKHSPYLGRKLRGRVHATLVRGKVVYRDGQIVAPVGYGRLADV
jgi:allantoinase